MPVSLLENKYNILFSRQWYYEYIYTIFDYVIIFDCRSNFPFCLWSHSSNNGWLYASELQIKLRLNVCIYILYNMFGGRLHITSYCVVLCVRHTHTHEFIKTDMQTNWDGIWRNIAPCRRATSSLAVEGRTQRYFWIIATIPWMFVFVSAIAGGFKRTYDAMLI